MAENSKIEWTDHTFNPWRGCTKVSPGCEHCYAEKQSKRNPKVLGEWGPAGKRAIAVESYWQLPLKWNREAEEAGERRRVFALSLGDWLEDRPDLDGPRLRLLDLVWRCQHLDWLLLTKRPRNFEAALAASCQCVPGDCTEYDEAIMLASEWLIGRPPANVWLGVSIEDQRRADERIPLLLKMPAPVRFLSVEPLLGSIDLLKWLPRWSANWQCQKCEAFLHHYMQCPWCGAGKEYLTGSHVANKPDPDRFDGNNNSQPIDWIIVGGESGAGARPMHRDWARTLRNQCEAAGVPFFFKQWGEWIHQGQVVDQPVPDGRFHRWQDGTRSTRLGKARTGRRLDGREWSEMPTTERSNHADHDPIDR